MKVPRIDIGAIRREQIVEAAVAVIAEQGLQNLSLSEIEKKVGMSRGQLTYYFKAKEEILLAVFDHLLLLMCRQHEKLEPGADRRFLDVFEQVLQMVLRQPPANPAFPALQYTFLSQMGHREDFRRRLADLYEEWRRRIAEDVAREGVAMPHRGKYSPRSIASVVQALLHGLAVQSAADPQAFDAPEVVGLCLDLLSSYLGIAAAPPAGPETSPEKPRSPRRERRLLTQGEPK